MDYRDEEYLKLFKQVNEQKIQTTNYSYDQLRSSSQMLKETPDYSNYNKPTNYNQNLNEVQRNNYSQDFNINEFNIETRINGQNINEVKRQDKEERLNEVMQKLREERLNEVKKNQEIEKLNETVNFHDTDIVSVEMFNKARYNSMMQVANRILPK
jgi:hypothetical protein